MHKTDRNNKNILVIQDYFSKWTEAPPMPDMLATTLAKMFINHLFTNLEPLTLSLHCDKGKNFDSNLLSEICQLLGIKEIRLVRTMHPQSDNEMEHFNRTVLCCRLILYMLCKIHPNYFFSNCIYYKPLICLCN